MESIYNADNSGNGEKSPQNPKKRNPYYYEILKQKPTSQRGVESRFYNIDLIGEFDVGEIKYNGEKKSVASDLVEVMFKAKRKKIYKNPKKLSFFNYEYVIVEVDNGFDIATVISCGREAEDKWKKNYTNEDVQFSIVRLATEKDMQIFEKNRKEEPHVVETTKELAKKHKLEIKVTDAEWQLDRQRLTIYFSAPQRVDFRELVKDLAKIYKTRIELRQISTREEARRIGGMGPCGFTLCCSTFSCQSCHVTLEHARTQRLANNVSKLSGYCGRLKCCILYEHDVYVEEYKNYPPMFSVVELPDGIARIHKIDVFSQKVHLLLENTGYIKIVPKSEIDKLLLQGKVRPPDKVVEEQLYDDDRNLTPEDISMLENDM
ncbi:MAG: stage 0 sporulation family protein [Candidatus Kapaibacteriota bacterium]